MSNKSPFELRTELLQLSQEYLQSQYEANLEYAQALYDRSVKTGQALQEDFAAMAPKFYSFEDVLANARKLYDFVSTK